MALEVGWRFYVANFGSEIQRALYLYSRAEIAAKTSLFRALPFVNYGLSPAHDQVSAQGNRGPEVTIPKPPGPIRIVSLGGSTNYGAFLDSYEKTCPHQLQLALANDYGMDQFERNLGNIESVAQPLDVEALLLTWAYSPYKYDRPFGDVMRHEIFQREIASHNDIIRELAAARGTLFLDLAEQMPIEREY